MNKIDVDKLFESVSSLLSPSSRDLIEMKVLGESALQITVDRAHCLTNIGLWPSGLCDIDYLYVESEKGEFNHYELQNIEDAVI